MNNITNNPVSSSPMGSNTAAPIATPQGTQVQGTSNIKAGASVQPYTFVDGPAGPDTTQTSRLSSSGMPPPASPPQTARESAHVAAFFNAMAATPPADAKSAADISKFTLMMANLSAKLRKGTLDNRNAMMFVQQEYKKQAIQKEKDAAYKDLVAGIVSGVGQGLGAAVGTFGSIKALKNTRLDQNLAKSNPELANAERRINVDLATSTSQAWNSAGNVVSSGFSVASSSVTYEGAMLKAEQKNLELKADQSGNFMAQEGDLANTYRDLFNSSKETFNTNTSTQTQMANSIRG
jgi:hypothetical protein